jgi:transcriptional regulator with XRE-family HTH domain
MKSPSGSDIFKWRSAHNLTQQQAADVLGVSIATVQSWETDRRNPPVHIGMLIERLRPEDYPKDTGSAGKRPAARRSRSAKARTAKK